MKLKVLDKAPHFQLMNQQGQVRTLKDYKRKWLLIYFYPKDDTPGCTREACAFKDNLPRFEQVPFSVVGISKDSVKSHAKFADKYKLNFDILADEDKQVIEAYGVWGKKKFMGREYMGIHRISFLVDPKGRIAKIYEKVNPSGHADEVLADVTQQS